jgi:hypothetical protein
VSAIVPVANVSAVSSAAARPHADRQEPKAPTEAARPPAPVKHVVPIRYYGGLDGMNATNLIVALQANGFVSDGYSARAIETGGTPPPALIDKGA